MTDVDPKYADSEEDWDLTELVVYVSNDGPATLNRPCPTILTRTAACLTVPTILKLQEIRMRPSASASRVSTPKRCVRFHLSSLDWTGDSEEKVGDSTLRPRDICRYHRPLMFRADSKPHRTDRHPVFRFMG